MKRCKSKQKLHHDMLCACESGQGGGRGNYLIKRVLVINTVSQLWILVYE